MIRFAEHVLSASMDNIGGDQLSLDLDVDLNNFVASSEIVVGASHGHDGIGSRDQYQFGSGDGDPDSSPSGLEIHTSGSYDDHFRGCIEELRIGGVLVPFFNDIELVSNFIFLFFKWPIPAYFCLFSSFPHDTI